MSQINVKALYDTCRRLAKQIREQTAGTDGKKANPEIVNALDVSFRQILDFERMYLIKAHNRFYGALLMEIDLDIDFSQQGPIDLKVNEIPLRIGVNPIECVDYTFPEFTEKIIEELYRMMNLHPAMYKRLNSGKDKFFHDLLEKASSAEVTSIIERDVRLADGGSDYYAKSKMGCKIPKDSYTTAQLKEETGVRAQSDQSMKYYFDILKKFGKRDQNQNNQGMNANNPFPNGIATPDNNQGVPIHQWENAGDADEIKENIISVVKSAYESLDERSRGNLPSGLTSMINALLAPPQISWTQVLAKMVGSVPVPYRRTRARLNRRQPYRTDLSGRLPKRTVNIVCCFDTSGSMSDEDLKYCVNEVFNIIKSYDGYKVTIIECDAEVQRVYEARKPSEVQTKMKGRGGTCFTPAIQFINGQKPFNNPTKYPKAGKFKDALMVYFTDGYGESEIPKPLTYRNLWVVLNGENNLSLKQPYGDVKSISTDKNYLKMKGR